MSLSPRYIAVQTYSEHFPVRPEDNLQFVRQYPTELLLQWLSKINAIIFQQQGITEQSAEIFAALFPGLYDSEFLAVIQKEQKAYFSSAAIAGLIKECLENLSDGENALNPYQYQFGRDLFKTILIFNEIHFKSRLDLRLDSFEGVFRLDILQQNYIRSTLYYKTFSSIKFAFVAKYLVEAADLKQACREFCDYYEVGNPWLFGKFFLDILQAISAQENFGKNVLDLPGTPPKIINEFTIDPRRLKKHTSLSVNMHIIPRPFYKLKEGALILDYNFFQYPIDQGVFFLIYNNTSLRKSEKFADYDTFKGYIGLHYFEQFLVKNYLSAIFWRKSQRIVSTDLYQDFIVKSGKRVLVIEVKSTSVHAKTLEEMNFESFKSIIDENFLSEKSAITKSKGVSQILRQVEHLNAQPSELRGRLGLKDKDRLDIYPVIIYEDANFDISGVNEYVNRHIATNMTKHLDSTQKVRPVTMINVSVLIDYFAKLRATSSQLTEWICDYHDFIKKNNRRYQNDGHTHHFYLSSKSFASYLKDKFPGEHLDENIPEMKKCFDLEIPAVR